jgi:hypothetical protein
MTTKIKAQKKQKSNSKQKGEENKESAQECVIEVFPAENVDNITFEVEEPPLEVRKKRGTKSALYRADVMIVESKLSVLRMNLRKYEQAKREYISKIRECKRKIRKLEKLEREIESI